MTIKLGVVMDPIATITIKKDKEFETFKTKLKEAFPQSKYLRELE